MNRIRRFMAVTLATSMAVMPTMQVMASAVSQEQIQTLSEQNERSQKDIDETNEHYNYVQEMQKKWESNPSLQMIQKTDERKDSEITVWNREDAQEKERQIREDLDREFERRSATREQEEPGIIDDKEEEQKYPYQEILGQEKELLTDQEKDAVEEAVAFSKENAVQTAEKINQLDDAAFRVAVKEVLDEYYTDEAGTEKQEEFAEVIAPEAEELLEQYAVAQEERENAANLEYEPGCVIVTFNEDTPYADMQGIADCLGGEIDIIDGTNKELSDYRMEGEASTDRKLTVKITIDPGQTVEQAKQQLQQIDCVAGVDANAYIETASASTRNANDFVVVGTEDRQPYLGLINTDQAWDAVADSMWCNRDSCRATIAVIDTGFDVTHDDLKNVLSPKSITVREKDADGNFKSLFDCKTPYYDSHGSHVAGIIAAETNNGKGIVGITNVYDADNDQYYNTCELIGINAGSGYEGVQLDRVADAIYYAIENKADVINMSFGQNEKQLTDLYAWETAVFAAHYSGAVLVAAAGNEGQNKEQYPAGYSFVIGVASLDLAGEHRRDTSNFGKSIDIAAPGTQIVSCYAGGSAIGSLNGTSMAAPMVTAAVGMMRAVNPDLSPEEIEKILYATATDLETTGWDQDTGYGRLDIGKAVSMAKELRFADITKTGVYTAECYQGSNDKYSIYGQVELNTAAKKYIVYRAQNTGSLGIPVMELGRNQVITRQETNSSGKEIQKNYVQFAQWLLSPGKYYYNIMAVSPDGRNQMVIGNGITSPFEMACDMQTITLTKSASVKNGFNVNYSGTYTKYIVTRAKNVSFTDEVKQFEVTSKTFTDTAGKAGETYYYKVKAVRKTDHVTCYSKESNVVSVVRQ